MQLQPAKEIKIQTPIDFSERDISELRGKPIVRGETTALYTFSGEPRAILIETVHPNGIVVVMPTTNVTLSRVKNGCKNGRASHHLCRHRRIAERNKKDKRDY